MKNITASTLKAMIKEAINDIEREDKEERSKKMREQESAYQVKQAFDAALLTKLEGYAEVNLLGLKEIERLRKSLKVDFDAPF